MNKNNKLQSWKTSNNFSTSRFLYFFSTLIWTTVLRSLFCFLSIKTASFSQSPPMKVHLGHFLDYYTSIPAHYSCKHSCTFHRSAFTVNSHTQLLLDLKFKIQKILFTYLIRKIFQLFSLTTEI